MPVRRRRTSSRKRVRYAVIGQGYISQVAVLPAFAHARRNSELAALFSDDEEKLRKLGRKYGVDQLFGYDDFERGMEAAEIDAVYIALPNDMHREYTERAARAGVHVLCEKPMAVTEDECKRMITAAERNGVKLMIAYRLHFEEANLQAVEIVKSGRIGQPPAFDDIRRLPGPAESIGARSQNAAVESPHSPTPSPASGRGGDIGAWRPTTRRGVNDADAICSPSPACGRGGWG